ncbi:hypothetical protein EVAR_65597_1 [Eumeta japonica]|uniref:Uncharacterized protein n=1 Tax=Eumeta variegata TaxID=151549 RepID=A0A4C1ZZN1_EUMVA|nr:hypothetical protein EVAR_65597_1 [Eumeta japonica]
MHPPAHMSCIHYNWEGVAKHFAYFTYERHMCSVHGFVVVPYTHYKIASYTCTFRSMKQSLKVEGWGERRLDGVGRRSHHVIPSYPHISTLWLPARDPRAEGSITRAFSDF